MTTEELIDFKENYCDSIFLEEEFDEAIMGVDVVTSGIVYNIFGVVNLSMRIRKDEFDGDIEDDNTDEWHEFYEIINEQVIMEFNGYQTQHGDRIPPILFQEV